MPNSNKAAYLLYLLCCHKGIDGYKNYKIGYTNKRNERSLILEKCGKNRTDSEIWAYVYCQRPNQIKQHLKKKYKLPKEDVFYSDDIAAKLVDEINNLSQNQNETTYEQNESTDSSSLGIPLVVMIVIGVFIYFSNNKPQSINQPSDNIETIKIK